FPVEQVGLHEGDPALYVEEQLGDLLRRPPTAFIEQAPPLGGDALDAGFYRDTARVAQPIEHLPAPLIDTELHPEDDAPLRKLGQQPLIRQEDLVNEVHIRYTLFEEAVELFEDHGQAPAPVGVAEVILGAEGAVKRAAARRLDLGARAARG